MGDCVEISIIIITYNHEKYIRQTLDSVISQKITVPYEIVIFDDASTDGTIDIIREYQMKYCECITLYINEKNSYPNLSVYLYEALKRINGKYYAAIEGDDYWIDEYKIQKQYDILMTHDEFSACSSGSMVVDQEGNIQNGLQLYDDIDGGIYNIEDFKKLKRPGMTPSMFYRNYYAEHDFPILYQASKIMGDITAIMIAVMHGDIYQMKDVTSAYRYVISEKCENFNSIQRDNIFYDLMILKYWIRLENYGKKEISSDFELYPIENKIVQLSHRYDNKIFYKVLSESRNERYLKLGKLCAESELVRNFEENKKLRNRGFWEDFKNRKRDYIIFGAGNLAIWYMDQYGWDERILFVVDNDQNKWDKPFKGTLVKKPDFILEHPEAMVLVISEKSEKSIEDQLIGMGISEYYFLCDMLARRTCNQEIRVLLKYQQ